jgi:hypothetical protein
VYAEFEWKVVGRQESRGGIGGETKNGKRDGRHSSVEMHYNIRVLKAVEGWKEGEEVLLFSELLFSGKCEKEETLTKWRRSWRAEWG